MKLMSIIVIIATITCLCILFPYHQIFYNPKALFLLGLWLVSVVMFLIMHEGGVPWPWTTKPVLQETECDEK